MLNGRTVLLGISTLWLTSSAVGQGNLVMFDVPGAKETIAQSINDEGTIVGSWRDPTGGYHGFIRDAGGTITTFDVPGSIDTYVVSINHSGAIAGYYIDAPFSTHGYVRDPSGKFTSIDAPGGGATQLWDMNDLGETTGDGGSPYRAFLLHADGAFSFFNVPGSNFTTQPRRINVHGTIVGNYMDALGVYHGFVRERGGKIAHFDPPNSVITTPNGLNASGTIVGGDTDAGGHVYGYERDPSGHFTIFQDETPTNINEAGTTIGTHGTEGYVRQPNGTVVFFSAPPSSGCKSTGPTSINRAGVVTGACAASPLEYHSFVRTP
jgi:YD repeat-containing protein